MSIPTAPLRLVVALLLHAWAVAGQTLAGVSNSKELKNAIYTELEEGDACIRLLNVNGTVGCAAPPDVKSVEGLLVQITDVQQAASYPEGTVFLVAPELMDDLLLAASADPELQRRTAAVLVQSGTAASFSPASVHPLAEYALYADKGYEWNPQGTGLNSMQFPFPVFLLDNETTASALQRAQYNAGRGMSGALNVARMQLTMQGTGNSEACLKAKTCLPLGGHSVAAVLPPLRNATGPEGNLPLILVLAALDTTAFFHEKAEGANAPTSGLIAMLAAAQILGASGSASDYTRHVVFAGLAGETWGYMGSKRWLWEMDSTGGRANASQRFPPATAGLSLEGIETVIELRQVGRALSPDGSASFYLHHRKGHNNTVPLWSTMKDAAANTTEVPVSIQRASAATPGLPPSSTNSFLRVGSDSIRAAVIEDFDTQFRSATYESIYDTESTVNATSITAAALMVARAVHVLALGDTPPFPPLRVNATAVNATVSALLECLLGDSGLRCPLAAAVMTPVAGGTVGHYISVLRTITEDPQSADTAAKKDLERLVWNFLAFAAAGVNPLDAAPPAAEAAAAAAGASRCQPYNASACPAGTVCAGYRSIKGDDGKGACLKATVRYIPSYSTSLNCQGCNGSATAYQFRWQLTEAAREWEELYDWPPDPIWTESNWPSSTPHLELFLKEDASTDWALFASGLCVSVVAGMVALATHAAYERRLKRM